MSSGIDLQVLAKEKGKQTRPLTAVYVGRDSQLILKMAHLPKVPRLVRNVMCPNLARTLLRRTFRKCNPVVVIAAGNLR